MRGRSGIAWAKRHRDRLAAKPSLNENKASAGVILSGTATTVAGVNSDSCCTLCSLRNVRSLGTFWSLGDLKFHLIPLLQALISFRCYCAVVHEDVSSIFAADKPVPLGIVEPLNRTFQTFHLRPLKARIFPVPGVPSDLCHSLRYAEKLSRGSECRGTRKNHYLRFFLLLHW
jgi:hypothetical protein